MKKDETIYILGISAFYHDSAACLLKNGEVVSAIAAERLTRIKHDSSFPLKSINFCLETEGITMADIDYVAYYEKPLLKFDRIFTNFFNHAPKGFAPFKMAVKSWFTEKLWVTSIIRDKLNYSGEIKFGKHHESHAASACFTSPFEESAFITMDGVGEYATTTFGLCIGNEIETVKELHYPNSLGLLYSAFTFYCGFKVNSGEYKLMGLAPYGNPVYADRIKEHLISIKDDGSFELNMHFFGFQNTLKMVGKSFSGFFGQPIRKEGPKISQFYKDIAASIQMVLEEIVLKIARHVRLVTGKEKVCLAGGIALNCVANGRLQREKVFDEIWIQPASGDSGTAVGVALLIWHQLLGNPREIKKDTPSVSSFLGPSYSNPKILLDLEKYGLRFSLEDGNSISTKVAHLLGEKKVIGFFTGKAEFGPRALGNRSILASPTYKDMQSFLNLKIKKREDFRPFAPVIMEEFSREWFDMKMPSKSMLFTYDCLKPEKIPSCVHVDGSSRVQTVNESDNPCIYSVLREFYDRTSIPVLINTSFNVRGEPIVCSPDDAIRCFLSTDLDVLVLGNYLVLKDEQENLNKLQIESEYELD